MPKKQRRPPLRGRYTYAGVVKNIAERIERMPRGTTARLAAELGLESHQFSHRLRGLKVRFSIEELGVIAARIEPGRLSGAPVGWPFVDWTLGEIAERAFAAAPATILQPPAAPATPATTGPRAPKKRSPRTRRR